MKKNIWLPAGISIIILAISCTNPECNTKTDTIVYAGEQYPVLACTIFAYAQVADLPGDVFFCFDNTRYTMREIAGKTKAGLPDDPAIVIKMLAGFTEEKIVACHAKKMFTGTSDGYFESLRIKLIDSLLPENDISSEEVMNYYKRNRIWFPDMDFDSARKYIAGNTLSDRKDELYIEFCRNTGKLYPFTVSKKHLDDIMAGLNKYQATEALGNGKASILVFSYGCCKPDIMIPELEILKNYFPEEINIVHVDSKAEEAFAGIFRALVNPTILIFNKNGVLKLRLLYHHTAQEIIEKLLF